MGKIFKFIYRDKKVLSSKIETRSIISSIPNKPIEPYSEVMEPDRLKNLNYKLLHTVHPDGSNSMTASTMQVALLMDIRRELQALNESAQKIEQNTRKTQRIPNARDFVKEIK